MQIHFQNRSFFIADSILEKTLELAEAASRVRAAVLITGESGTGKELIARYIHEKSKQAKSPFISINCAAIPEGLLEAELFGFERGAFTGAMQRRIGKFEQANHGTLLLDEVSEMPVFLQAKLLRALQEKEVDRIGSDKPIPVDTRIIATSNRNLFRYVQAGEFRGDLFYRLNVIRIECQPLRNRPSAIEKLAEYFLEKFLSEENLGEKKIAKEAMRCLLAHSWPGNIRELQNAVERACVVCSGQEIQAQDFELTPLELEEEKGGKEERKGKEKSEIGLSQVTLSEVEKTHILSILDQEQGNRTVAAKKLGITTRTLRNKLKEYV